MQVIDYLVEKVKWMISFTSCGAQVPWEGRCNQEVWKLELWVWHNEAVNQSFICFNVFDFV